MYCKTCGKEINDEAVVCPYCGCAVKDGVVAKAVGNVTQSQQKINVLSIVGFVLSLVSLLLAFYGIVAIVGLVLSIVGLIQCNQRGERLKGLAIAGIIISVCSLIYTIYVLVILATVYSFI